MPISRGGDAVDGRPISIGEPDKVDSWPFPEPEKKSAWTEAELSGKAADTAFVPKDVPVRLVDFEREKAERRTVEIKQLMSPPGGIPGLPPLLEEARLKWGIPDGAFVARAIFDRIHIFPIDAEGEKETYGNTQIHRSEAKKTADVQKGHRGILISMGLEAMDHCVSHGIELGHIVRTIRNAPHVQEIGRISFGPMYMLVMRDGDLTGSETLEQEIREGKKQVVNESGDHGVCFQLDGYKKRRALVADGW